MFKLVLINIQRRPLRSFLTSMGVGVAIAVLALIDQIGEAYKAQLTAELNSMGLHLMLVPLGCPYDAAARVLKGNVLETSLPESALHLAKNDPGIEIAAPMVIAAIPRLDQGRTDMFVGLDENGIALKRWWRTESRLERFPSTNSIILGADAAIVELRQTGDRLYSPETGRSFEVAGILQRSGTSDDSLFFIPLKTAQEMFNSSNRLTAVSIRLRDPSLLRHVTARLQEIPGVQVVTQTEMMGTFLNILGTVRTLLQSIGWVALCASVVGLSNTLLMSVVERSFEFSLFRAIGASRTQLLAVVSLESALLTIFGVTGGLLLCIALAATAHSLPTHLLPFSPPSGSFHMRASIIGTSLVLGGIISGIASLYPAWRSTQAHPASILKGAD